MGFLLGWEIYTNPPATPPSEGSRERAPVGEREISPDCREERKFSRGVVREVWVAVEGHVEELYE